MVLPETILSAMFNPSLEMGEPRTSMKHNLTGFDLCKEGRWITRTMRISL
jgi:hypothetical protein